MRYLRISIALLLVAGFTAGAGILSTRSFAQAGTLRIALLSNTQVQGDVVLLADFFPPHVSPRLRAAAQSIALGASPQIGSFRRFSRDAVTTALRDPRFSLDSFLVPEFLTARRAGRFLTQQDVFSAIKAALAKNSNLQFPALRPDDLALESLIELPNGPSGLEVTQLTFDEPLRRARFRLWSHNAPGTLPFYVTTSAPGDRSREESFRTDPSTLPHDSAVLVDPRQLAHLHLHSPNSTIQLVVRPLQRGHLHETIRVRLPTSGRTLQATVVGANSLDATF